MQKIEYAKDYPSDVIPIKGMHRVQCPNCVCGEVWQGSSTLVKCLTCGGTASMWEDDGA